MELPRRHGGSFAPPLTDERLAAHKATASALPPGAVRDALWLLLRVVEHWWGLPEPTHGPAGDHPSGLGKVVPLAADHKAALDDLIPWEHELEAVQRLCDGIEADVTARNSAKVSGWYEQVGRLILAKHFPDPGLVESVVGYLRAAARYLNLPIFSEEKKRATDWMAKLRACEEETAKAFATKAYPGVPYPTPEPTPVRNCAFHLLWHVKELDLGREPITKDKLGG